MYVCRFKDLNKKPAFRALGSLPAHALCLLLSLSTASQAQNTRERSVQVDPVPSRIDRLHYSMSASVNDAARWVDSFFEDERFISEEASSRIRLRPSLLLEEGEKARFKLSLGARLNVPNFNRKLKLVVSDESDLAEDNLDLQRFTTPNTAQPDDTNISLQYTLRDKARLNTHIAIGAKFGGDHGIDLFIGPRLRKTWKLNPWQLRFTERIRWYTDIGWESGTRLDLERVIHSTWFFRGTLDARLREDDYRERGLTYNIGPTLVQKLRNRAAIEYQWNTEFSTRPSHGVDQTGLRLRFRKQVWRDWLFYEINPQLVFRNRDDFRAAPGIEFRLEASFGGLDEKLRKTGDAEY